MYTNKTCILWEICLQIVSKLIIYQNLQWRIGNGLNKERILIILVNAHFNSDQFVSFWILITDFTAFSLHKISFSYIFNVYATLLHVFYDAIMSKVDHTEI